jgi:cathepsin L
MTGTLFELSPQELVSCAPNKQHCGGSGGCTGSTAELAFDLVRDHGMVQEWAFGYQDGDGGDVRCTLSERTGTKNEMEMFRDSVVSIIDYAVLPSNNYTVLMNTVAKLGPVTVSVACLPWHLYQSGVFYAPLTPGEATDLDHLVVLEGYGTDEESGEDYWLVRNSWGPLWGEKGYIRLKQVGSDECGVDETPADGTTCTLDPDGNEIVPEAQTICGNSGILFDTAIPLGGHLL